MKPNTFLQEVSKTYSLSLPDLENEARYYFYEEDFESFLFFTDDFERYSKNMTSM